MTGPVWRVTELTGDAMRFQANKRQALRIFLYGTVISGPHDERAQPYMHSVGLPSPRYACLFFPVRTFFVRNRTVIRSRLPLDWITMPPWAEGIVRMPRYFMHLKRSSARGCRTR